MNQDPFKEYIKQSEPSKKYKGYAWSTAIGLQAVDGLEPSEHLVQTAIENIEGNNIFDSSIEVLNTNRIKETYKRQIMYFEQDLLSLITDSKFEIKEIICPIIDGDTRKLDKKFFLIHFAGKEFKPWIDKICCEDFDKSSHVHSLTEYKEFYKKVANLFTVNADVKIIKLHMNYKTIIYKKLMHIFLEKVYSKLSQYISSCSFVAK